MQRFLIATGLSAATIILSLMLLGGHTGADGPDAIGMIGYVLLYLPICVAMYFPDLIDTAVVYLCASIQFFAVYWYGLVWAGLPSKPGDEVNNQESLTAES